jgi:phenylalanyl-tRNA synthetase alpha chain
MDTTELDGILNSAKAGFAKVASRAEWEGFKATILGPKGSLTAASKAMAALPAVDKPAFGKKLNEIKRAVEASCDEALARIEAAAALAQLGAPLDPTVPLAFPLEGSAHPISQMIDRVVDIFTRIGFEVRQDTEIETEWFCFDALNSPADHPSRDMQDTYYMPPTTQFGNISPRGGQAQERFLMRTQTSTSQIRKMVSGKPPYKIIVPGRCFRRDNADAGHSSNFHQIEGLYIDKNVTITDFKAVLDYFIVSLFGPGSETRLRPSYFPFVEPGFEMDFRSPNPGLGKFTNRWVELMGCGMVQPKVLENVGVDPKEWTGYAFGAGIERMAMMLHGIEDIRYLYQNDARFLKQLA